MNTKLHSMVLNTAAFLNLTDYYEVTSSAITRGIIGPNTYRLAMNSKVITHRGIEYIIDDSLSNTEIFSRRETKGGDTYYYV